MNNKLRRSAVVLAAATLLAGAATGVGAQSAAAKTNAFSLPLGNGSGADVIGQDIVDRANNTVWVVDTGTNTMSIIDGKTNQVSQVPTCVAPGTNVADQTRNRVFVGCAGDNSVWIYDGDSHKILKKAVLPDSVGINDIGYDSVLDRLFVTSETGPTGGQVIAYDGHTLAKVGTVNTNAGTLGIGVNSGDHHVYITNYLANSAQVIDGSTMTVVATVATGVHPFGFGLDVYRNFWYIVIAAENRIQVVDLNTFKTVGSFNVGVEPHNIAVNANTQTLYSTDYRSNTVTVVNLWTYKIIATYKAGVYPHGAAYNAINDTFYSSNRGTNDSTVIQHPPAANPPARLVGTRQGECISGNETYWPLVMNTCNEFDMTQKWVFNADGTVSAYMHASKYCLAAASPDLGSVLQANDCDGSLSQQFHMTASGQLVASISGGCVQPIDGFSKQDGLYLDIGVCAPTPNPDQAQYWTKVFDQG
jgi:YVTN family beta-propeller protein